MPPRYVNTVPQGLAGTGNATIFGANPVAAQFGNQLAALRRNEYEDELRRGQEAEKLAQRFRDNQLAASQGRLWARDIGSLEQDHIQKGIELRQKGVDPYGTSPGALEYQKERRRVEAMQGYRKSTEAQLNELDKLISANPDKYDPRDIAAVHDFFEKTKLSDAYSGNLALPGLRERFNMAGVLKGVNPVTAQTVGSDGKVITDELFLNKPATKEVFISTVASAPGGKEILTEASSGLPASELEQLSADPSKNEAAIKKLYAENRPLRDELAADGILYDTPGYDTFVSDLARNQASMKRKWDNFVESGVAAISGGLKEHKKVEGVKPDLSEETLAERIRHNKAMEARARANAEKGADTTATDVRRGWIQDIRNMRPNALEKLIAAGNATQEYDKNDTFKMTGAGTGKVEPGKGKVKLHIPRRVKLDSSGNEVIVSESRDYIIDLGDPNFETTMNTIIGDVTGARVDLGSVGAKGANIKKSPPSTPVKAAPAKAPLKTINKSEIPAKAKAAGYTEAEYTKMLKDRGITIK